MIKKTPLLSMLSLFIVACTNNQTPDTPPTQHLSEAERKTEIKVSKAIAQEFARDLKNELMNAVKTEGFVAAIPVCNKEAIPIGQQVSKKHSAQVNRVSLKARNPDNTPNAWQTKILHKFDQQATAGESIKTMGHAEFIQKDGKQQLHFMKAIPTGSLCLTCHGTTLAPDVSTELSRLYPDDKARGYSLNQVRGAIVVVRDIN